MPSADDATMATRAPGAAAPAARSRWILNSWRDLLFFIGTPVLILPLVSTVELKVSVTEIALYVATFGAIGHHVPGMMRAYGDRELFERFRTRFILAPIFFLAVCISLAHLNTDALAVMVLMWGVWHGLAQVYGFARIYDAKAGTVSPWTPRLDLYMCIVWFGAGIVFSPGRMAALLTFFYAAGGPLVPPGAIQALQPAWALVTAAVTLAFTAHLVLERRRGRPASPVKLLLFFSSFGFWWYAMVSINNVILGVALFEIFHDVQYLSLVWIYNRKRVESGHALGGFMRFVFGRSSAMIGVYVGLVFAYGYGKFLSEEVHPEVIRAALYGFFVASSFLHFYYDSFIWSVRERSTQEGLGIAGGRSERRALDSLPGWVPQALKWSLFVVPLAFLAIEGAGPAIPEVTRARAVAAAVPDSGAARTDLGVALGNAGEPQEAVRHYLEAIRLQPDRAEAHSNLGVTYLKEGQWDQAPEPLRKALDLDPASAGAHEAMGRVFLARGDTARAGEHFQSALESEPEMVDAHYGLGILRMLQGDLDRAADDFRRALEIAPRRFDADPGARTAFAQLSAAFAERGDLRAAEEWSKRSEDATPTR